jgi:hypothetical protein
MRKTPLHLGARTSTRQQKLILELRKRISICAKEEDLKQI